MHTLSHTQEQLTAAEAEVWRLKSWLRGHQRAAKKEAQRRQLQADLDRLGSVQKVADEHGLSRQRVYQLIRGK